ncbi:MAG: hypothetical protein HY683_04285 [Chloroflexi bacterium]|nr:hypothetical protein [Chloroflexota bacterium]
MVTVRKRRDLLLDTVPELYPYKDDGCEVSSSCLRCPLPRCKYDEPGWLPRWLRQGRDGLIRQARERERLTVPELAQRFQVSQRTVFRALARGRATPPHAGRLRMGAGGVG